MGYQNILCLAVCIHQSLETIGALKRERRDEFDIEFDSPLPFLAFWNIFSPRMGASIMKKDYYSTLAVTLLVLACVCLYSSLAASQECHFIILPGHLQNHELLMGELETLGVSDTEFAHLMESIMATMLADDVFLCTTDVLRAQAELLKLAPDIQASIREFIAQLPVPDVPIVPTIYCCYTHCRFGSLTCCDDTPPECGCGYNGYPWCFYPSSVQPSTWGKIKALYRAVD
jgi:hypothetical protein